MTNKTKTQIKAERENNAPKKEWKACMSLTHRATGKIFYLYLPDEAISFIPTNPDSLTVVNNAVEALSKNDPDMADFVVLKWNNTPYGDLTGLVSINPRQFAA